MSYTFATPIQFERVAKYTVTQKTVQNYICQNFVKFPLTVKIFGTKMVKVTSRIHHDVLVSTRLAFNKFQKKCKTFKYAAIFERPHDNWCVSSVNQRMGNVLVASTSVLI